MNKFLWMMFAAALLIASPARAQTGGGYDLTWSTVDGGGMTSTGGGFELSGTIGQPEVGPQLFNDPFVLNQGFWFGGNLPTACVADLNGDGFVDFVDYLEFLNYYDAGDLTVDFTGDLLVDFADYLEFLNLYNAGC